MKEQQKQIILNQCLKSGLVQCAENCVTIAVLDKNDDVLYFKDSYLDDVFCYDSGALRWFCTNFGKADRLILTKYDYHDVFINAIKSKRNLENVPIVVIAKVSSYE